MSLTSYAAKVEVEVSQAEIQAQITKMMPVSRTKLFMTVTVSNPEIELIELNNRLGITADIEVSSPSSAMGKARTQIVGDVVYLSESGELYFKNATVERLVVSDVGEEYQAGLKDMMQLAVSTILDGYPVYQFKGNELLESFNNPNVESFEIKGDTLFVTLLIN